MEEKTKAENMNLDNIITDIISAEEQEDSSARVLQVPAVALRGMTVLPGLVIHFDLSRAKSILAVEQAMMSGFSLWHRRTSKMMNRIMRKFTIWAVWHRLSR